MKHALITGGAGFIGSNLARRLMNDGWLVSILDNLTTGKQGWMPKKAGFLQYDMRFVSIDDFRQWIMPETVVFHLQGLADVRHGAEQIENDFDQNVATTHRLLDFCAKTGIKRFVFSSSAVVYGEPDVIPTPETYAGIQTSIYGAHKLAAESEIQAYASYFGMQWLVFRFVSFLGPYYHHGVVHDFVRSLQKQPEQLHILGDGNQTKSYLHVMDGIEGILLALASGQSGVLNLGHDESVSVHQIVQIVTSVMGLKDVAVTRETHSRGWIGDSPVVKLCTKRIKALGWKPTISIEQAIRETVTFLLDQ